MQYFNLQISSNITYETRSTKNKSILQSYFCVFLLECCSEFASPKPIKIPNILYMYNNNHTIYHYSSGEASLFFLFSTFKQRRKSEAMCKEQNSKKRKSSRKKGTKLLKKGKKLKKRDKSPEKGTKL